MIKEIFDFVTFEVKWDNVKKIKEFKKLIGTQQSSVWHKEGDVWVHTQMVVQKMQEELKNKECSDTFKAIMILSALFHDIGKGETTYFDSQDNEWHSASHDEVGYNMTRKLLKDDDCKFRECIAYFVKNHMKPLYIPNSYKGIRDAITVSCDTFYPDICNIENLILLKKCDCLGSIVDESKNNDWQNKLSLVAQLAEDLSCKEKPYDNFDNYVAKYEYFNMNIDTYPTTPKQRVKFYVHILFGVTDAYALYDTLDNYEIVSKENVQERLSDIYEYLDNAKNVAFDSDGIDIDTIEAIIEYIYYIGGGVVFVYGTKYSENLLTPTKCMSYLKTK